MKATINGIEVQGTPEEIHTYIKLINAENKEKVNHYINTSGKGLDPKDIQKVVDKIFNETKTKPIIFGNYY
jgi:hypothetical protein